MLDLRLACAVPLLLAACSDPAPTSASQNTTVTGPAPPLVENTAVPEAEATPEVQPTPGNGSVETVGGDGSQIVLAPLDAGDSEGLDGELGCSFAERKDAPSLLIARADVGKEARPFAAVRNAGVLERLAATAAGGFGAMEKGLTFGGKGLTVRVTPEARVPTGDESVAQRATLLVQRADGAERRIAGLWTCGP
ncbi:hypothetical protein [Sphingomonas sp. DT-207]|uniref:hypothetical protein n=1 Tax=Sphingomonas sp. DT-207 TaxID=3396167 RepID=UPI003F5401F5